jgi:hypothetical protein
VGLTPFKARNGTRTTNSRKQISASFREPGHDRLVVISPPAFAVDVQVFTEEGQVFTKERHACYQ